MVHVFAWVIGLASAIDDFDPERGNRLSTLAVWRIRTACRAFSDRRSAVRFPAATRVLHPPLQAGSTR